jgi:hypothetical protein
LQICGINLQTRRDGAEIKAVRRNFPLGWSFGLIPVATRTNPLPMWIGGAFGMAVESGGLKL